MKYLYVICILALLASCTKEEKVQTFYHGFTNQTWNLKSPIEFGFEISDTSQRYDLQTEFRYNEGFNFNAMKLNCSLITPSGSSRFKTSSIKIHNEDGTLAGTKVDNYYAIPQILYKNIKFSEVGKWTLNISHALPIDIRNGIVGLEFELIPQKESK